MMVQHSEILFHTDQYRVWIDRDNIGRIKIIRRINLATLINIIRQITVVQLKETGKSGDVCIYYPASLKTICSDNLLSFIEFCKSCCDMNISIIESE